MSSVLGIFAKQSGEGVKSIDQAFRIVEPVNADGERPATEALAQPHCLRTILGMRRGRGKSICIDADWIDDRPDMLACIGETAVASGGDANDFAHAVKEGLPVDFRMEPDDVIAA